MTRNLSSWKISWIRSVSLSQHQLDGGQRQFMVLLNILEHLFSWRIMVRIAWLQYVFLFLLIYLLLIFEKQHFCQAVPSYSQSTLQVKGTRVSYSKGGRLCKDQTTRLFQKDYPKLCTLFDTNSITQIFLKHTIALNPSSSLPFNRCAALASEFQASQHPESLIVWGEMS